MQWTTCGSPSHSMRQMLKFRKQPDNYVGINIHHKLVKAEDQPHADKSLCHELLKAVRVLWRWITTCQLCSHAFLSTHCCDKILDKTLDKMLLHLLMLGQVLNISQSLQYAPNRLPQATQNLSWPWETEPFFFLHLAHYGSLYSQVIGRVVPCICSVSRVTADPAVEKWVQKDRGRLCVYFVSLLHLRRSTAQERGQAQLWKSLWSPG